VTVSLFCDLELRRLVVDVADQGTGIADRDKHKLFASFSKVQGRSDEELVRGAGLGLYISRRLMQSMGGDVWVKESRVGHGSTFTFTVPFQVPSEDEAQAA
jgi:signal transduction histidine kinase